jgi:hypothetical protein
MDCYKLKSGEELILIPKGNYFNIRLNEIIIINCSLLKFVKSSPYLELKVKDSQYGDVYSKKAYLAPLLVREMDFNDIGYGIVKFNGSNCFDYVHGEGISRNIESINIKIVSSNENINYHVYLTKSFNINLKTK